MDGPVTPEQFRAIWDSKPTLRSVYRDYYMRIEGSMEPGRTVEIGAGSGNLHDEIAGVIATDIVHASWLACVVDAQRMPFADGSLTNIVGVDVLHHLEYPRLFLSEAERVLRPGGRAVFVEPGISVLSWIAFKLGHPEPVELGADPCAVGNPDAGKHPFDSNQALPTLLVGRHRAHWEGDLPHLRLLRTEWLSIISYPLSGGFRPWCLLPSQWVRPLQRLEDRLPRLIRRALGFRLLLVLERL